MLVDVRSESGMPSSFVGNLRGKNVPACPPNFAKERCRIETGSPVSYPWLYDFGMSGGLFLGKNCRIPLCIFRGSGLSVPRK